jgi:hypothetical protein
MCAPFLQPGPARAARRVAAPIGAQTPPVCSQAGRSFRRAQLIELFLSVAQKNAEAGGDGLDLVDDDELLRPHAYSEADIARIKSSGSFATLYQQCVGSKAEKILSEDFGTFLPHQLSQRLAIVLSVDANQIKGNGNSYSVIQTCVRGQLLSFKSMA